jgi:hypothetical protein
MTRKFDMKKPLPEKLPYYRVLDEEVANALQAYYEKGVIPEPFLLKILQRDELNHSTNPYTRGAVFIHRWVQQWMPKRAWGSRSRVEKWHGLGGGNVS